MSTLQTNLVTIGALPHPTTHTAVADWNGRVLEGAPGLFSSLFFRFI